MVGKIQHWSTNLLSYVGRKQLVQSVLMIVIGYWMQVFPLPKKVIHQVDSIHMNFLWSGKATGRKSLVSWENTCLPKNAGGLNFKYLVDWNRATLLKMLWNIHMKADKLWIQWITVYCLKGKFIMECVVP